MLVLDSVNISYGAIKAVRDVSLKVGAGEVVSIIGANGAGKSTLLKGIAGLEPLAGGRVSLDGVDITDLPAHKRLGLGVALSPEGRGVFPDQSVMDNLLLGAFSKKYSKKRLADILEGQFDIFPLLRERKDQMAGTLSGGEQQMLTIARALMSEPRLLLLDEPSLGLAPLIIREIFRTIRKLRDLDLTILLVEQMAIQALAVANRGYVLETGRITLEGVSSTLRNNPQVRAAYLGSH